MILSRFVALSVSLIQKASLFQNLLGPWYTPTRWNDYHWDLNTQFAHWAVLPTNMLNSGESLVTMLQRQMSGLIENVDPSFRNDSAAIYSQVGWDLRAQQAGHEISPPNELGDLTWVSHNMWLQYRYSMDKSVLSRVGWELLRRTANFHTHFANNSSPSQTLHDGKLHTPLCGSPEYPPEPPYSGHMFDCSYDLALWHWVLRRAIFVAETMPEVCGSTLFPREVARWKATLPQLADYAVGKGWPAGEKGYAVGAFDGHPREAVSLDSMQRHFSHLFMIYPLHNVRYGDADAKTKALMSASVDWYAHYSPPNGFSKVGIAGMTQSLDGSQARSDSAWGNLTEFLHLSNISPNTQYWESSHAPCNESPLGWTFAVSQTFVRSWQGVIEVFPSAPSSLENVELAGVLTEGAFLVSARRVQGATEWVRVEVAARPGASSSTPINCSISVDSTMAPPWGFAASRSAGVTLRPGAAGTAAVLGLRVGDSISLWSRAKGKPARPMKATPVAAGPDAINQWGKHVAKRTASLKSLKSDDVPDCSTCAHGDCPQHCTRLRPYPPLLPRGPGSYAMNRSTIAAAFNRRWPPCLGLRVRLAHVAAKALVSLLCTCGRRGLG